MFNFIMNVYNIEILNDNDNEIDINDRVKENLIGKKLKTNSS